MANSGKIMKRQLEQHAKVQALEEEKLRLKINRFRLDYLPLVKKHKLDFIPFLESNEQALFAVLKIGPADAKDIDKRIKELKESLG
jgi:hypothetical protein